MQIGRNAFTGELMRVKDAKQGGSYCRNYKMTTTAKSPTKPKK